MGIAEFIARRPIVIVALWIVVALVAAPLFAQLNKVTKVEQYSLPPNSEAMKAQKLLDKLKSGGNPGIIIVQGVDLRSNNTLLALAHWASIYNKTITSRHVGRNLVSVPLILAELNKTLYKAMLEAVNRSATAAAHAYSQMVMVKRIYAEALENATKGLEAINKTAAVIAEADRGYAEAYKGLEKLAEALNKTETGLRKLDQAYVNATRGLLELASRLNQTTVLLARLDEAYAGLSQNITMAARRLTTVLANRTLLERLAKGYALAWWQTARTYELMQQLNGNYTAYAMLANLSAANPALKPLPEEEAVKTWRTVALLSHGGCPDAAAAQVAAKTLQARLPGEAQALLPVIEEAWMKALHAELAAVNASCAAAQIKAQPPSAAVKTQLLLLNMSLRAAKAAADAVTSNATRIAAALLAQSLEAHGIPAPVAEKLAASAATGRLNETLVAELVVNKAVEAHPELEKLKPLLVETLLRYDPHAEGALRDREKALEAAEQLLIEAGAPREAVAAARRLLESGGGRAEAARLALSLLEARLPGEARALLPTLAKLDPEAKGALIENTTLLAKAATEAVEAAASKRGAALPPRSIVEKLALEIAEGMQPSPQELRSTALRLVEEEAAKKAGEEKARLVAEVLAKLDPDASGRIAANKTLAIEAALLAAKEMGRQVPFTASQVEEMLGNETALRWTVYQKLREEVMSKAPPEARPLMQRFLELLWSSGPNVPPEKLWSIIEDYVAEKAAEMSMHGQRLPRWAARLLAAEAVKVAKGVEKPREAARLLAEKLLLAEAAPKVLSEAKGLMVSRELNGFLVIFEPMGATQKKRAENILEAGRLARETLSRMGFSVTVEETGPDLLFHQVREYSMKDAEKTSRISEAATFIVLLIILESVFAVILPYLGIGLGLVAGGALVYLGARAGIISLDTTSHVLMITTALGLGADYAAYIVHRFREEYAVSGDARRAAEEALRRAGPAVLASALTVMIGFGSLLLGWDIAFLRGMGETIPITVAATAAAGLTLVPALLSLLGGRRWFWWPRRPSRERHVGRVSRLAGWLVRHRHAVLAVMAAVILVSGYYYVTFKGSHDMKIMLPSGAEALKAFDTLKQYYLPGITDPVHVVAVLPGSAINNTVYKSLVDGLAKQLRGVQGVGRVLNPLSQATAAAGGVSRDGRIVDVEVILAVDPYSDKGIEAIKEIHRIAHSYAESHGFQVYLGGAAWASVEMDKLLHRLYYTRILPAASLLMVAVFTLIFGGLPAAVAALIVIMGAAMIGIAASVIVFQDLLGKPVLWFLHIVSMVAVLGVGMDYNSFFLARALEECRKHGCSDPEKPITRAAGAVSLFIIGLSLVVSSAYLSLLASSNTGMREMGFTLGLAVLTAGAMAAYLLTPVAIAALGDKAWWPWGKKRAPSH